MSGQKRQSGVFSRGDKRLHPRLRCAHLCEYYERRYTMSKQYYDSRQSGDGARKQQTNGSEWCFSPEPDGSGHFYFFLMRMHTFTLGAHTHALRRSFFYGDNKDYFMSRKRPENFKKRTFLSCFALVSS